MKFLAPFLFVLCTIALPAQEHGVYKNLDAALKNPSSVKRLFLEDHPFDTLPASLAQFKNIELLEIQVSEKFRAGCVFYLPKLNFLEIYSPELAPLQAALKQFSGCSNIHLLDFQYYKGKANTNAAATPDFSAFKKLQFIEFQNWEGPELQQLLEAAARVSTLKTLWLVSKTFDPARFPNFSQLRNFEVYCDSFTDGSFLRQMPQLDSLTFHANDCRAEVLKHIPANLTMLNIDLPSTLNEAILAELKTLKKLKHLTIYQSSELDKKQVKRAVPRRCRIYVTPAIPVFY